MRTTITIAAILFCSGLYLPNAAKAQGITQPRTPSPAAEVTQRIGISDVKVNYSRPAVREREIWGALIPYGWNVQGFGAGNEAPWRAGANENTTITLSHDVMIQGKKVPAGSYGMFFVINEDNTGEVVLSAENRAWGSFWYDQANDVMRAPIQIKDVAHTERLTYDFINLDRTSAEMVLNWEKKQFPVKIEFDVDAIVLANAKTELHGSTGFSWQGFNSGANYLLNNSYALDQALIWATAASNQNPSFTTLNTKAGILEAQGKADDATEIRTNALAVATEGELNTYAYQLMNQGKNEEAIKVFKANADNNPESANAWDSLGEGLFLSGNKKESVQYFKKALSLNPPANVKANSEKYLGQIGE
ncbi:MAG: DUF2911 domain-containing protein [Flavobacteriales bacterium]|nr:DUF2911 domain-containing protein [Flavobacteriales bacterium]